MIDQSHRAH